MTLIADGFLNLRTPKNLVKFLKNLISDGTSRSKIVNRPKYYSKLNDSTFTIYIDTCEDKSVRKILSEWKSWDCFLTHRLPMTSILFITEAIYCNISRCLYLRKKKYSLNLFLHFINLDSILNIFKERMTLIADVFLNLRTPKSVVR